MNQEERLDYLIHAFMKAVPDGPRAAVPEEESQKRDLLCALMSAWKPDGLPQEVLDIQNDFLAGICNEREIVQPCDIPTIAEVGSVHPFACCIAIWQGDITRLACDAIVNAADPSMLERAAKSEAGCFDNDSFTLAGVQLRLALFEQMECLKAVHGQNYTLPAGSALITPAYNLPSMNVIHIAAPRFRGVPCEKEEVKKEEGKLARCYHSALDLCAERSLRTIAFPCIASVANGFCARHAAEIAVSAVTEWIRKNRDDIDLVIFVVSEGENRTHYEDILFDIA